MPRKIRKKIVDKIVKLAQEGYTNVEIREKTGISLPTIRKILKASSTTAIQPDPNALHRELAELRQEVEQLKEVDRTALAMSNLPTKCQNGHSLLIPLHCVYSACSDNGEYWGTLDGTEPHGPLKFAFMHFLQKQFLHDEQIPNIGEQIINLSKLKTPLVTTSPRHHADETRDVSQGPAYAGPPSDEEIAEYEAQVKARANLNKRTQGEDAIPGPVYVASPDDDKGNHEVESDDGIATASFPGQQPSEYVDSDDFDGRIVPERFLDPEDEEEASNKKAVEVENGKTSQSPIPQKSKKEHVDHFIISEEPSE